MFSKQADKKSFWGLILAQFLGAFNDFCFKSLLLFAALAESSSLLPGGSQWETRVQLTIGATILFTLPFILFSTHAGRIADRFSKRSVTVWVKIFEILIMIAGTIGFWNGDLYFLIGVLFLMALQSTLFSPSKYGILPELLPNKDLPRANGILELSTFIAMILGTVMGGILNQQYAQELFVVGLGLTALAVMGFAVSLTIRKIPAAVPERLIQFNPIPEMLKGFRAIFSDRTMRLTALGITYFWSVAVLL